MKKHTTGKVRVDKSIAYTYIRLENGGFIAMLDNLEGSSTVQKEHEGNAELIEEAFNVANETGKTPRQLAEINEGLLEALQVIPPERLNDLAEFMDKIDYEKGFKGTEVQDDLRKMAKLSATAIHNATK